MIGIVNRTCIGMLVSIGILTSTTTWGLGPKPRSDEESNHLARKPYLPNQIAVALPPIKLSSEYPVSVELHFTLPERHHLNAEAPSRVIITSPEDVSLYTTIELKNSLTAQASIPRRTQGRGTLELSALLYYCETGNKQLCLIRGVAFSQPYDAIKHASEKQLERVEHQPPALNRVQVSFAVPSN